MVYGKTAVAAAISRGIEVRGFPLRGRLEIESPLGRLEADLQGERLARLQADKALAPLQYIFSDLFSRFHRAVGLKIAIHSSIPDRAGLASSAAVSSALIALIFSFLGERWKVEEAVELVYASELRIQRRGSVIGSSCTVNGGFVCVSNGKWRRLAIQPEGLEILIVDTGERCATSDTTARVRGLWNRDPKGAGALFDEMNEIAEEGRRRLEQKKWDEVGSLMNRNQERLRWLGVSTPRIDSLTRELRDWVYGAKITGAGGGGCVLCLPKEGAEKRIAEIVMREGGVLLEADLCGEGVCSRSEETLCRRSS